jgi:Uma2 family endonuclease
MHMPNPVRRWTIDDLATLPDDGNTYEIIRGALYVTPPPADSHETILARLNRILDPYAAANGLGLIYRPRAVIQIDDDTQLEPDLMVRRPQSHVGATWRTAPLPILVVEVASDTTRRRDRSDKRSFYLEAGVPEYWIMDGEDRTIRIVIPDRDDVMTSAAFTWHPAGAAVPLVIRSEDVFGRPGRIDSDPSY